MTHVLMPVRTVAEWGGVHEWVVDASRALIGRNHKVTIVGAGELFAQRARGVGAAFVEVDWSDLGYAAKHVVAQIDAPDLIFAHAPQGRMLALELRARFKVPTHVMIHGAYHDFMYTWADQVDSFPAASLSLMYFAQHVGKVEPWKCSNIGNGVADEVFELPIVPLTEKLSGGVGRIVTASRLARDKTMQIDSVERALRACVRLYPDVQWNIDVYGDGPLNEYFESRYQRLVREFGHGAVAMHGWVDPTEVPKILNRSVVSVMAGMGGVRGVASGSLVIGTGARNALGVQVGANLRAGIWSNFGDHGCPRFEPTPIESDLEAFLRPGVYEDSLTASRDILRRTNSQTAVDSAMLSALQLN